MQHSEIDKITYAFRAPKKPPTRLFALFMGLCLKSFKTKREQNLIINISIIKIKMEKIYLKTPLNAGSTRFMTLIGISLSVLLLIIWPNVEGVIP